MSIVSGFDGDFRLYYNKVMVEGSGLLPCEKAFLSFLVKLRTMVSCPYKVENKRFGLKTEVNECV